MRAKWNFKIPSPKKILIYDREGSEELFKFLNKIDCYIYDVRGESINFLILFITIFKNGFKNLRENYKKNFINIISPQFIFTMVDNNLSFFYLKYITKAKIISIQNTYDRKSLVFQNNKNKKKPLADYMCVSGDQVGYEYSKYINCPKIIIGNFDNNEYPKVLDIERNSLTFISQFKSHRNFPNNEKMILKILKKFCKIRSLKLYISTRIKPDDKESLDKYKNIIGAGDWEIVPRKHKNSSLERICKSEFIVFVSSSLGYAALSRGKKVLSFAFGWNKDKWRSKHGVHAINPFGYLLNYPDEGPFWLNTFSRIKIIKKLDFLTKVTDLEWSNLIEKHRTNKFFLFDHKNKNFKDLLNKLDLS